MTSADLTELLRASRPVAPDALRERVRAIAAATPAASPLSRFRLPRLRLVVPAVAATALAAAALIAVVRPAHERSLQQAAKQPRGRAETLTAQSARRPTRLQAQSQAPSATVDEPARRISARPAAAAPAPTSRPRRRLPGADRPRGEGQRRALERHRAGAEDRARPRRLRRRGRVRLVHSGSASLTLRVPTAKVQDAIAQLTALGKITSQQVQIQRPPGPARPALPPGHRAARPYRPHHRAAREPRSHAGAARTAPGPAGSAAEQPPRPAAAERGHLAAGRARDVAADAGDEGGVGDTGARIARRAARSTKRAASSPWKASRSSTASSSSGRSHWSAAPPGSRTRMRRRNVESRLLARG